jgi:O-antigen/teichoic acid export membrane protein
MTTLSTAGLCILAAGIGILAPELTELLAGERWGTATADAARVTPIVAVASVAYGLYYMVVSAVFLERRTKVLPLLTISAGLVNVGLNLLLIPRIGIIGAAWATMAGYATLAALTAWYARRVYPIALDLPRLALLFGSLVALLVAGGALTAPLNGSPAGALAHLGLALAFAVLVVPVVREPLDRLREVVAEDPGPGRVE